MSSGRKIHILKEEFNGTNWATWHLAIETALHVAKATELAFEGKPRPVEPPTEIGQANKKAAKEVRLWDEAYVCGLQAIRANTAVSHYSHVYNKKYTTLHELWNYLVRTFQQTNPAQQNIATS